MLTEWEEKKRDLRINVVKSEIWKETIVEQLLNCISIWETIRKIMKIRIDPTPIIQVLI